MMTFDFLQEVRYRHFYETQLKHKAQRQSMQSGSKVVSERGNTHDKRLSTELFYKIVFEVCLHPDKRQILHTVYECSSCLFQDN